MKIQVTPNVSQILLRYYKQLRTNPKYKITFNRAWEKFSNFYNYIHSGIRNDLPKGRFCKYYDLGQRYLSNKTPKYPYLKYLQYKDKSNTTWYIAYVYNQTDNTLTITSVKNSALVIQEESNRIIIKESQLRSVIRESIKKVLNII